MEKWTLRTLGVLAIFGVWLVLTWFFPPQLIPPIGDTLVLTWETVVSGDFVEHMTATIRRVVIACLATFVVAFPLGVGMGFSRRLETFAEPGLSVILMVPGLMWVIMGLLIFGISETGGMFAIALSLFGIVAVNIWQGTKGIDTGLVSMGRVFGVSRGMMVKDIIAPQLLTHLFAAVRYSFSFAWRVAVIVEMLGMSNGVGFELMRAYQLFQIRIVFVWVILFGITTLAIEYLVFGPVERVMTRWRPSLQDS